MPEPARPRRPDLGTLGCLAVAAVFLGHLGFALLHPEYYRGSTVHLVRYVAAPGALAAVFLALAFLAPRAARAHAAANALALIAAIYAAETWLQVRYLSGEVRDEADQADTLPSGTHWSWTPARINAALEVESLDAAVLGHLPRSRVRLCWRDYGPVDIETDRHGLSNPDPVYDGPIDVAFVGDSFLHGYCLPPGSDIVGRLRRDVPPVAILNIALTGAGPLTQHALIGRYLPSLRPPHVVMCFFEGNDLEDLGRELGTPWTATALADPPAAFGPSAASAANLERARANEAGLKRQLGRRLREGAWSLLASPKLRVEWLGLRMTLSAIGLHYAEAPAHLEAFEEVLRRSRDLVAGWSGRIHLCYLPDRSRYTGLLRADIAFDVTRERVAAIAERLGIDLIDVAAAFGSHPRPWSLYASDSHFSIEGAAVAAEVLADRIKGWGQGCGPACQQALRAVY